MKARRKHNNYWSICTGLLMFFLVIACSKADKEGGGNKGSLGHEETDFKVEARIDEASFESLKYYYGDNHFHSGFSGDNMNDEDPIVAFYSAFNRALNWGSDVEYGGDSTEDLGGYFLVLTDHLKFVPTRQDMTNESFQKMRNQADSGSNAVTGRNYTFTAFPGGEITGLRRSSSIKLWDDKFGHINVFNLLSVEEITENNLFFNTLGNNMMDLLAKEERVVAQINHPGYGGEPIMGNSSVDIFPFTTERDRVFNLIEVTDGRSENWDIGVSQYHKALQKGFHLSPVVGTDIHNTKDALFMKSHDIRDKVARTVVLAPETVGVNIVGRRKILVEAINKGRVYATEDSNLQIKWSINGVMMGGVLPRGVERYVVKIEVKDVGSPQKKARNYSDTSLLDKITLVKGYLTKESYTNKNTVGVTTELKRWLFKENTTIASIKFELSNTEIEEAQYLVLTVGQKDGDRAITAPIYLE